MTFEFSDAMRKCLPALNSATKYPSIPTYHELGDRGRLTGNRSVAFGGTVLLTEKVDGTNSRVIVLPNGNFIIGSRDSLLYAKGDFVLNRDLSIVETLLSVRETKFSTEWSRFASKAHVVVLFLETFGHGIGKSAKKYAGDSKQTSARLFDVVRIPVEEFDVLTHWTPEKVSHWREHGGQSFDPFDQLSSYGLPTVPIIGSVDASKLPVSVQEASDFLNMHISDSLCPITSEPAGQAEGFVLRTNDRVSIAKARFDDYRRTLGT